MKNYYKWKNEQNEGKSESKSDSKENTMVILEGDMVVFTGESSICVACQDTERSTPEPLFMFLQEEISLHPTSPVKMVL